MELEVFHALCVVFGPEDQAEHAVFERLGDLARPCYMEGALEVVVDRVKVGCLFFGVAVEEDGWEAEVDVWGCHCGMY